MQAICLWSGPRNVSTALMYSFAQRSDTRVADEPPCGHYFGIDFNPAMLNWPRGAIAEDGVWAKHWYHSVHESTGFSPYAAKNKFPPELTELINACAPHYEQLFRHAIRARTGG